MSDDMNKKIQQIAELLGQESMPDNVKGLLSALAGSLGGKENKEEDREPSENAEPEAEEKPVLTDTDNSELLQKAKSIVDSMRTNQDPRINLLHAIKPFMSSKRQKKISNCIQLLQMTSLTKLMDNQEK